MMTPRGISWAAVSTRPQAERESLHDQHRLNHALAEALGWEIAADITVPGESRSYYRLADARAEIDAYPQLEELVTSGAIDWLICKDRSRLGRTRRLNQEVANWLQDHGVRIYSRAIPPSSTSERTEADVWGEAIESGYSEAEILRLKQRREMGMQGRTRQGKLPAAPPWGFRYVTSDGGQRVLFDDPQAEAVIRFIVDRFIVGLSKREIARQLNAQGRRTRTGQEWGLSSINNVLFQPAYYSLAAFGRRRHVTEHGRRVRRRVPPAEWITAEASFAGPYTPDDWKAVLAEHRRRAQEHPRRRAARYPLSGIAWCADCQQPMVGSSTRGRCYYRCEAFDSYARAEHRPGRGHHYVRREALHRELGEHLQEIAAIPGYVETLMEQLPADEGERLEEQRIALLAAQDELLRRRRRWDDAYEAGLIDLAAYGDRISDLEREETGVTQQLERVEAQLRRSRERLDYAAELQEALATLPVMLAGELTDEASQILRAALSHHLTRAYVQGKTVTRVDFRLP